jgi:ribonuclease HI
VTGVTVDIYCDASILKETAAWGCVVVRPEGEPFEASGRFAAHHVSSTVCELRGAANALFQALKAGLVRRGDKVVIRCDNLGVVERISGERLFGRKKRLKVTESLAPALEWIRTKAAEGGFEVTAEWVKGHQPADSPDPHVQFNRRADRLCAKANKARKAERSSKRPGKRERARQREGAEAMAARDERAAELKRRRDRVAFWASDLPLSEYPS